MDSEFDAILVPGGGVRPGGVLPSWVRRRLDRAVERADGSLIVTLSAGTTHRPPPLDARGFPIFESIAAASYLIEAGVPPERILTETVSYDTVGNAYFSRVVHADPRGLRRLLVITSDFHLARTRMAFEWVYGLAPRALEYELHFEGVEDPEIVPPLLSERVEKERASLEALLPKTRAMTTMREFHHWLFTEHVAYRSQRPGDLRASSAALDSY